MSKIGIKENITTRIGPRFKKDLDRIRDRRVELGLDKHPKSDRWLTTMISKHQIWKKRIMADIAEHEEEEDSNGK